MAPADVIRATFALEPAGSAEVLLVEETHGRPGAPLPASLLGARVVSDQAGVAVIEVPARAYPGVANLVSALVAGEACETRAFTACRLVGLDLPAGYLPGPAFAPPERLLVGAIIKPSVGLGADECAAVAVALAAGGVDVIKDDELAADHAWCGLEERVAAVCGAIPDDVAYFPNLTGDVGSLLARAERAVELGAGGLMVNGVAMGLDSVRLLRDADFGVPVLCHRVGAGPWVRNDRFGCTGEVLALLQRWCGADVLLAGSFGGKLFDADDDVLAAVDAAHRPLPGGVPRSVAMIGGGVGPGNAAALVGRAAASRGGDVGGVLVLLGSAAYGHPGGVGEGARATVEALAEAGY